MIDPDVELVIDGETLSKEGKLLNLNARRAHENYGDPPQPLLGAGIHDDLDSLIESIADGREIVRHDFVATWSLSLAAHLMTLSPVLLGLGILALLVEFKTPGFGVFGVAGIALIAFVNFGHNVAGLSGYEGLIIFVIGALLVFTEVVFFPGVVFLALSGIIMMLGGIVWSMADMWPQETPDFDITFDLFLTPIYNLFGGILIALVLFMALARFLPKSVFWDRMILAGSVEGASQGLGSIKSERPVAGAEGIAVSDLFPTGEIEIGGQRFEARVEVGFVSKGSRIRVLRSDVFGYFIEEVKA
jgi:membrane-bound serine protease (ClpP class)